jgi:hypothetical protein
MNAGAREKRTVVNDREKAEAELYGGRSVAFDNALPILGLGRH